jgi:hypothetical protein
MNKNFDLKIDLDSADRFISLVNNSRKLIYFEDFHFEFSFGRKIYKNSGDLITSIHSLIIHLMNNESHFYCFDDGNKYFLELLKISHQKFVLKLLESNSVVLEEFSLTPAELYTSLLVPLREFLYFLKNSSMGIYLENISKMILDIDQLLEKAKNERKK